MTSLLRILANGIFLGILCSVSGLDFEDSKQDGVSFGNTTEGGYQQIYVDENNNGSRVVLVIIKNSKETPTYQIPPSNQDEYLHVQMIEQPDGSYNMTVSRPDYEAIPLPNIQIIVKDPFDNVDNKLLVSITNLDDENPIFTTAPCYMEENTTITKSNSQCLFEITDPDGFLDKMNFDDISNNELFKLEYKEPVTDDSKSGTVALVLQDGIVLDYESMTLYSLQVHVKDSNNNPTIPETMTIVVQVQDIPDMPPIWQQFTSAKKIDEETKATVTFSARDGDYGLNKPINYKTVISNDTIKEFINIDSVTGVVTIQPVDRDQGYDTLEFDVVAYEAEDETSQLRDSVTIMIADLDDNSPLIHIEGSEAKELTIQVQEHATSITAKLTVEDIDQGGNAMYDVKMIKDNNGVDYTTAFQVIPSTGYEKTDIVLAVIDPSKLDYESEDWKTISFSIQTTGTKDSTHQDVLPVTITLEDINDEVPEFQTEQLTVSVQETIKKNQVIAHVQATDKDAEDITKGVKHTILGTMANVLTIEEYGGAITTLIDNVFDYEKQQTVYVQIQAKDNANHTVVGNMIINVEDVNDETPRLTVYSAISVAENQPDGFLLTSDIKATDEDKNANLVFSIDWPNSYITKNSQRKPIDDFQCVHVKTIQESSPGVCTAQLSIIETVKNNTPNYEIFDTLVIQLKVEDTNQQENSGEYSASVVINIENINDNAPVFQKDTKDMKRSVVENSEIDTFVGVVVATDDDNLQSLNYSIEGMDPDTKDWIRIDVKYGNLYVNVKDHVIDCDDPVRSSVEYRISATDGDFSTSIEITIDLIDQNDNSPALRGETKTITEDNSHTGENHTNEILWELQPTDGDRDTAFKTVVCSFQESTEEEVTKRLKIEDNKIKVALTNGYTLDRETKSTYTFALFCKDNPQGPISNSVNPPPSFTLILSDVNDNEPTMTSQDIIQLNENTPLKPLSVPIQFEDRDDKEAGEISFEIIKTQRYFDHKCTNLIGDDDVDLFTVAADDSKKNAILTVAKSLKDHYGCLKLTLKATDGGNPPLSTSDNEVKVAVQRYNYAQPQIIFPENGSTLFLFPTQSANSILKTFSDDDLQDFSATDNQGDKYNILFKITEQTGGDYFKILNQQNSVAELQLKTTDFDAKKEYTVTIMAYLDLDADYEPMSGEKPYNQTATVSIKFFSEKNSNPEFKTNTGTGQFMENVAEGKWILTEGATYPVDIPLPVYYLMAEGEKEFFSVDITNGSISLNAPLDYETSTSHTVVIQASSKQSSSDNTNEKSKLTVTIEVLDDNDHPPKFINKNNNYGTVVPGSAANTLVTTVTAEDEDVTSKISYNITKVEQPQGQSVNIDKPFIVDNDGNIMSIFEVRNDMKGFYFILTVVAADEDGYTKEGHTDTTTVRVYVVTSLNTVNFKFTSELELVKSKSAEIQAALNDVFVEYQSQIEDAKMDSSTSDGTPVTIVPIYFIDPSENKPIEGATILRRVTNTQVFRTLKQKFVNMTLDLVNFQSETNINENLEETLKVWLIGVSVVLGALCLVLIVAFILKTRTLKQKISNLSNTKFGSQESGLNRTGVAAPTTNKHAVEGSNPVYNNDTEFNNVETMSVTSGDSDLIGIEDDAKFDYDYEEKDDNLRF